MADGSMEMTARPTEDISVRDVFGIDSDMMVKGFAERTDRVPEFDATYKVRASVASSSSVSGNGRFSLSLISGSRQSD